MRVDKEWAQRASRRLREKLGEGLFEEEWRAGQALSFDEAIAVALDGLAEVS